MTTVEKNRFIGVAFLVVAFYQLATLSLSLFGFSLTYPYVGPASIAATTVAGPATPATANKASQSADDFATPSAEPGSIPGFPGLNVNKPGSMPTPAQPQTKAQLDAQRTMTMIYVIIGVQFAILLFVLFAGFTVVSVRAGGRSLGIVASLFLLFLYPLGTIVSICAIWFLIGDDCLELYSEVEKDKRSPQSII